MTEKPPELKKVRRRHVFHIAGYDPVSAYDQHRRFLRQLAIFKHTWSVEASVSELESRTSSPSWRIMTEGAGWCVESIVELLSWDDLVIQDASGSRIVRLLRALGAYVNLIRTGTLLRYATANQRYFLFALAPLAEVAFLGILSCSAGFYVSSRVGWAPLIEYSVGLIAGLGLFLLLLEWPGRRWRIYQALDDWILSLDYVYGRRNDLEARLDQFANRIATVSANGLVDEIVIVGHSLGATFAVDATARALDIDPDLGRHGHSLSLVTVGATIPKCALHPGAQRLRDQIKKVADAPSIFWVEFQSRADAISFYRCHPLTLRRISGKGDVLDSWPRVRRVQINDMLRAETFAKYRLRVLRLHYQVVMANEIRAPYDYFMMICGPLLVEKWSTSPRGLLEFFSNAQGADVQGVGLSG